MKSLFRSLIISIVGILVTVGVANAVGVFYYDSVNDSFVLDGDMAISGGGKLEGYFKEINSAPTKELYINSQRDFTIQLGVPGSKFAVNNSANSRIFQVDDAGVLKLGDNLDGGRQGDPAKVNFFADGKTGNIEVRGEANLAGGIIGTGRGGILPGGWGELLRLVNPKNALLYVRGANLGFGFSGASAANGAGFYWVDSSLGPNAVSNYPMRLSTAGDLTVLGQVSSPNFTLPAGNMHNWSEILTSGLTEANLVTQIDINSDLTFGGMFALAVNTSPDPDQSRHYSVGMKESNLDALNPLNDSTGAPHIGCPKDFTVVTLVDDTVYMPSFYYCYKQN